MLTNKISRITIPGFGDFTNTCDESGTNTNVLNKFTQCHLCHREEDYIDLSSDEAISKEIASLHSVPLAMTHYLMRLY